MLSRRTIVGAFAAGACAVGPLRATAQTKLPIIGFLAGATRNAHTADLASLRAGLKDAGLVEDRDIKIEERYAEGDRAKIGARVEELIAAGVAVFLVPGPAAARAVKKLTSTPIVAVALPYSNRHPDLFAALNKPGGSITGFSLGSEELSAKRIQILREASPGLKSLAVLRNGSDPIYSEWGIETERAAIAQGLEAIRLELNAPDSTELARLMQQAADAGVNGIIVIRDFLSASMGDQIAQSALGHKIAALSEQRDFCAAGGLLSYGANVPDLFRRSATYITKILSGAAPGDLPIQLPTKFDLVVNLKTAEALGIEIPPDLLVQATEVIE
jgi:putative ABC transport system substrate-binding protein